MLKMMETCDQDEWHENDDRTGQTVMTTDEEVTHDMINSNGCHYCHQLTNCDGVDSKM